MSRQHGEASYGLYGPVRLDDGRVAVFINSGSHVGCCQDAQVLFEDGHHEIVNPDWIHAIASAPHTLDPEWYRYYRKRPAVKGWQAYAALKVATDHWLAMTTDEHVLVMRELRKDFPTDDKHWGSKHYPWPARYSKRED